MRPVETVEGLERSEARGSRTAGEIDSNACALLEIGELLKGLGGANAALVDVREERGERVASDAQADIMGTRTAISG
jgi:hypothetical protein